MTSTDMIFSMASGTSAASMTSTASTTSVSSMTSTASFHQKTELDVFIHPGTKMTYPGLSIWDGSSKTHYFVDLWESFCGGHGFYF
jgi:hypothetical protein